MKYFPSTLYKYCHL